MIATADERPYGGCVPGLLARTVIAITRRLPANWLGLRMSMPLRRLAIDSLHGRPVDTTAWGARMRLYPSRNACEKNALFTPQLFDVLELGALAAAVDRRIAAGKTFVFVDIGANVGLYSLYIARRGGPQARVLAVEPQPGIVDRLRFNIRANENIDVTVLPLAVADREGEVALVINERDSGGTHIAMTDAGTSGAKAVPVPCQTLASILDTAGISSIDALKIDIEGAEDLALAPFLREAPAERLPRLVLIEDRPQDWSVDLYALLHDRGYVVSARSRQNAIFRLDRV